VKQSRKSLERTKYRQKQRESEVKEMTSKVLSYGVVGLLAAGLLAGVGYILLNPTQAAGQGPIGGQGQGRGHSEIWQSGEGTADDVVAYGQGRGRGSASGAVESTTGGAYGRGQDEELSTAEIEGILYMREEEKLARDVYLTLYEQWELSIFQNIANSEQTHMDAIKTLIDRYGLDDPAAGNNVGEFTDPTLQSLYADLVATGGQSLADALRVGAAIEEIDILDLEERIAQTDAGNIQRVYESLTRGSRNHLRSFVATLERQVGETYEPQYLSQEAYDSIVSAPIESGGYGQGANGRDRGSAGQGRNEVVRTVEWETLTGTVTVVGSEITLQTAEGEVLVGMGQSAYRESFGLEVGDEVSVVGFYEDGEFKAGTVENLATGETIVLRDGTGRPMWAGQGRLNNQD
jgi:hypothetical protein